MALVVNAYQLVALVVAVAPAGNGGGKFIPSFGFRTVCSAIYLPHQPALWVVQALGVNLVAQLAHHFTAQGVALELRQ